MLGSILQSFFKPSREGRSDAQSAEQLNQEAIEHAKAQRYEEALRLLEQALRLPGNHADIWNNVGNVRQLQKQYPSAMRAYRQAIQLQPDNLAFWLSLCSALELIRDWPALLSVLDEARVRFPDDSRPVQRLIDVRRRTGDESGALAACASLMASASTDASTLTKVGIQLCLMKRFVQAGEAFQQAARLWNPAVSFELTEHSDVSAAVDLDESTPIGLLCAYVDPEFCMGVGLWYMGTSSQELAVAWMERALELDQSSSQVHLNLATAHQLLMRLDKARHHFEESLRLEPDSNEAMFNFSLHLLQQGEYQRGWAMYEARWEQRELLGLQRPSFTQPLWLGETPLRGQTLLVHAEQGLGDAIMFVRYVPMLLELGANVVLQVPKALEVVMRQSFQSPHLTVLSEGSVRFDLHTPVMSLPHALRHVVNEIPGRLPYLFSSSAQSTATLLHRHQGPGLKVGMVWAGNPGHVGDATRSIRLQDFLSLCGSGVEWYALQKDLRPGDAAMLARANVHVIGPDFQDFADTAAAIQDLDLVITVDTSVAHLSAAMGKPTWILLAHSSDYRWLLDREDSPWYPGVVRLFRQDASRQWGPVLQRVREALEKRVQEQD